MQRKPGSSIWARTPSSRVGWGVTVGRGTLAYGFLLSIVLATMFAGRALKDAVAGLGDTRHPAHLRSILAAVAR